MDRNTITGIGIIAAILIGYMIWSQPSEAQIAAAKRAQDSLKMAQKEQVAQSQPAQQAQLHSADTPDSVQMKRFATEYKQFAPAATGKKESFVLKNDKISLTISSLGARIVKAVVKNHKTYTQKEVSIFSGDSTQFGFNLPSIGRSTSQLFFTTQPVKRVGKEQLFVCTLQAENNASIQYTYRLADGSYMPRLEVKTVGMETEFAGGVMNLEWKAYLAQCEKDKKAESNVASVCYYEEQEGFTNVSPLSQRESETLEYPAKWLAFKGQFFSAAIIPDKPFAASALVGSETAPLTPNVVEKMAVSGNVSSTQGISGFTFYFGPNHYPTLTEAGHELRELVPLGWTIFGWINRFMVIPMFDWFGSFLSNYGLIILLMTIAIKMLLFPLTFKSYQSMAKMRVLKPELEEISKKYPGTDQALQKQQETMAMYRRAGVNPLGGCLPMLVQMPFLIAMFNFFPASIELRQKSFLWADDLSTYDSILNLSFDIPFYGSHISLFTLLMAISMVFINRQNSNNMVQAPGQPNMKVIMWIMSFMMLIWFNSYSSGLTYYYLLANGITLLQTYLIRKFTDDAAIHAKIKEFQKRPDKKSKFQLKMEEMARQRGMK